MTYIGMFKSMTLCRKLDTRRENQCLKGPDSVEKVAMIRPLSTDSVFQVIWETEYDDGSATGGARIAVLRVLD